MSSSSSAVPEKISAAANNQRLLITRQGLAVAIVASLNGGLVISDDQGSVISSAMEVATYNFRHASSANALIEGPDLVARTLGVRLQLVEFRGIRSNIGPPSEMAYGPVDGPEVRIISLDSKARSQTEYFSFVGPVFNNDLLTQANVNALLRILRDNEPHVRFAELLRPSEDSDEEEEPNVPKNNAVDVTVNASPLVAANSSSSSATSSHSAGIAPANNNSVNNNNNNSNSDNNSNSNSNVNVNDDVSGQLSLKDLYAEVVRLRQHVDGKATPVTTPVRLGSLSDSVNSPFQNSQVSNFSMMGFNSATPIYLEKVSSAEVRSFRQKMTMHHWPNPFYKYIHHSIFEYVKGQWNVFAETSKRTLPRFEDSAGMPTDLWFDTLEEVVAEVKFDDEGIIAPILQVSSHNGLPISIESFMQNLWKWLSKQERLHSRPSIRQQIILTLEKCPYARRLAEVHNLRMAEEEPQYPPRNLVSKINEIITNLSGAGQHVSEFVKLKKSDFPPKKQAPAGVGKVPKGSGASPFQKGNANAGKNAAGSAAGGPKDKDKDKADPEAPPKFVIKCHECGKEGHRRGDTVCEKFDPKLVYKKRNREESPAKHNKK
jgi:hypothetical protein